MQKRFGFTLIECLVALLIIAVVLASSTRAVSMSIADVRDSYVREAANWVADNQYASYSLNNTFPNLGNTKQSVTMAGIDFIVNSTVSSTANPYFRKIDIEVSEKSNPNYVMFKTVNFVSQY